MTLYPFVHVSALELHALSHYPGNRQNDRMTDRNTNRLSYAFAVHAHRGIMNVFPLSITTASTNRHVRCAHCQVESEATYRGAVGGQLNLS